MASCDAGDETACQAMGPGPLTYTTEQAVSGDQAVVIEEADHKLTVWTETDPVTGEQTRHLLYEDADEDWVRLPDSDYKILSDLTDRLTPMGREGASGKVRLYTERAPCDSCSRIIQEFEARFPGLKIEVMNDFTVDGAPL